MFIDPGGDPDFLIDYCEKNGLTPTIIVNTHGHGDHIGGNLRIKEVYPDIRICVHVDDAPMLTSEYLNLSLLGGKRYKSPPSDRDLRHNDVVSFEGEDFEVIHVPGHTKGGICLLYNNENGGAKDENSPILFSGDSLFSGSIGRTDLPSGDMETLLREIKDKLLTLSGDTVVYPGHGEDTTILQERDHNPFLACEQV